MEVERSPRSTRGHLGPGNHNTLSALVPPANLFILEKLGTWLADLGTAWWCCNVIIRVLGGACHQYKAPVPNVTALLLQWANKTAAMVDGSLAFLGLLLVGPGCCFCIEFCHHVTEKAVETSRFWEHHGTKV